LLPLKVEHLNKKVAISEHQAFKNGEIVERFGVVFFGTPTAISKGVTMHATPGEPQ
jgi:hypothetical protein